MSGDPTRDLLAANHILATEGIVDGFGHVSMRCADDPGQLVISRSLSPAQVTGADLQHLDLDRAVRSGDTRPSYAEVAIHAEIYRARPDVRAIVHDHSPSVIPYGVSGRRLRPVFHMASLIGADIPVWDIRDEFGDTDMLVRTSAQGASLARALGRRTVVLMRGHGAVVAEASVAAAVFAAYELEQNAMLQARAEALGEPRFLSDGEIERASATLHEPLSQDRVWGWFRARAEGAIR